MRIFRYTIEQDLNIIFQFLSEGQLEWSIMNIPWRW